MPGFESAYFGNPFLSDQIYQISPPPFVKHILAIQNDFGMPKIYWQNYNFLKKCAFEKDISYVNASCAESIWTNMNNFVSFVTIQTLEKNTDFI